MMRERNPFPFFRFFPANWLESTAVDMMLPEQEGAFIHLLARAWRSHPPCTLPADDAALAKLSRLGRRWKNLGPLVRAQFEEIDVGGEIRLRNPAQHRIYLESLAHHEQRKTAGQKGRRVQLSGGSGELFPVNPEPPAKQPPPVADEKGEGNRVTVAGGARAAPGQKPGMQMQKKSSEEANASSGASRNAPTVAEGEDKQAGPSPKDYVWSAGVKLLVGAGAIERCARSLLGRMIGDHGEERVAETIARAVVERPVDPQRWIVRQLTGAQQGGNDATGRNQRSGPPRPVTANIDAVDWDREAAEADRRRSALLARAHAGAGH